jgi:2-(1,2-epoxy-1,2-dihydrophenyl)acetyl-CoA isomerase
MTTPRRTYRDLVEERGPISEFRVVLIEREGTVETITLNDPAALNAYSPRMTGELQLALRRAEDDPAVRAVILTGAGRAFSAGGDLRMMRSGDLPPAESHEFVRREFGGVVNQIVSMDTPVVAAVNGHAMGVAFFTVLACDMVVASEQARFGTAYIHLGLTPLGVSYLLAQTIGYARAYELCALGEVIEPEHALRLGLVNRVVPHDRLLEEARTLAGRLAAGPPRALAFTKLMLRRAVRAGLEEHLIAGEAIQPLCLSTDDHREALRALAEKRPPRFTGT